MTPILYAKGETAFMSMGLGALAEAITCEITEERNGAYELEMQYPTSGKRFADIRNDCIIKAKPNEKSNPQPFRIYRVSKPMSGVITVYAEHISYQQNSIPVSPFTAQSAQAAGNGLIQNAAAPCPFSFFSDILTVNTYTQALPASFRSRLGGVEGSILDTYGGEYEFDVYRVNLWAARGADNGATILYGKNLVDLKQEENIQNVVTGCYPYWAKDDALVTLPEKIITLAHDYSYGRAIVLDLSGKFDEQPSEAELRAEAQAYMSRTGLAAPDVSITVDFINLYQTAGYEDIAQLEHVGLCDTVTVRFAKLGVDVKSKVVACTYDAIKERYVSMQIGKLRANLVSAMYEIQKEQITETEVADAVQRATNSIIDNRGGYIKTRDADGDGHDDEHLIMDALDYQSAVKLWRWNMGGLGYSRTGYNGTYGTAITMDGEIVADFMTTGKLSSKNGRFVANLDNNTITMKNAQNEAVFSFVGATGALSIKGTITAAAGEIGGWSIGTNGLSYGANTLYLGVVGITAAIGGTSRSGLIFKAGANYGVTSEGVLYANSAVLTNITADGGTFTNITASGNITADALVANSSISAPTITGGSINGTTISGVSGVFTDLTTAYGTHLGADYCQIGTSVQMGYISGYGQGAVLPLTSNTGNVGVGSLYWNQVVAYRLYAADGSVHSFSDRKLKENIMPFSAAEFGSIDDYRAVFYTMKDDKTHTRRIGFIANEVQEICPLLVEEMQDVSMNEPILTLCYDRFVVILLDEVQKLRVRVAALENVA